jgi:hypothetical protein
MFTRSRARELRRTMASVSADEEFPVNNQLGIANIFDDETEPPTSGENTRAGEPENITESPSSDTPTTMTDVENRGETTKTHTTISPDISMLMTVMQQLQESIQINNTKLQESMQINNTQLQETIRKDIQENNTQLKQEIKESIHNQLQEVRNEHRLAHEQTRHTIAQLEQKLDKQVRDVSQETNTKIQEQNTRIDNILVTVQQTHAEIQNENKQHDKHVTEKLHKTIEKVEGVAGELRREVTQGLQDASDKQAEFIHAINQDVHKQREQQNEKLKEVQEVVEEVNKKQKENEICLREITETNKKAAEEVNGKLDKLQEGQKRLQVRVENAEERRLPIGAGPLPREQITFSGVEPYPMEFLSELEEIQQLYYDEGSTRWINHHLSGDAATWWKLTRQQIHSFQEFKDVFIQKYWDELRQEHVRHDLEYGRYEWHKHKSMSHYMEGKLLEVRHLTPAIPTAQIIRKISKHFGREIQLATLTRGIKTITEFGSLLDEYETLMMPTRNARVNAPTQQHNESGTPYGGNTQRFGGVNKYVPKSEVDKERGFHKRDTHKHAVSTMEIVNSQPSTSGSVHNGALQQQHQQQQKSSM